VRITVSIVLHDSGPDIRYCLAALGRQTRPPDVVVVLDNGSIDHGLRIALDAMPGIYARRSEVNLGFAAGQNQAMAAAPADVHVVLNPDCQLGPTFIERACEALERDATVGSIAGRLLRFSPHSVHGAQPAEEAPGDVLDSTGMLALRNRRVLDRGSDEPAAGRYGSAEYVFGATGAAAVYRRAMLESVAFDGQFFDEEFFAYREDVDLAWRAQLLGWRCLYLPSAVGRHRRRVAPGRRHLLPASINRQSVANRWRMIGKNETSAGWRRDGPQIAMRDLLTVTYCLLREPRTLRAVVDVVASRHRLRAWRRDIMGRRTASDAYVAGWFGHRSAEPFI